MKKTTLYIKYFFRVILISSVIIGMPGAFKGLSADAYSHVELTPFENLFALPGIVGWLIICAVITIAVVGAVMMFFQWVFSNK